MSVNQARDLNALQVDDSNMVNRIRLTLGQAEHLVPRRVATVERRSSADQVRHILWQDLVRCGLLPADASIIAQLAQMAEGLQHGDT